MKHFLLFFVLVGAVSCQIDVMDPTRSKAVVPDTQAKVARKLYLDGQDGRTIRAEERYVYDAIGQLERVERLSYDNKGNGRMYSYDAYTYSSAGQLNKITYFAQTSSSGTFQPTQMREFSYPAFNRITELIRNTNVSVNGGSWNVTSRLETLTKDGKPLRIDRYGINNQQQYVLQYTQTHQYEDGRLVAVESRDGTGKLYSTNRYTYKGRTATVAVVYPASSTGHPFQYLLYDGRGRLIRQRYLYSGYLRLDYSSSTLTAANQLTAFEYVD